MTVEVDDAGWGDLVGGCVIVARRVETGEHYVGEIPVEFFQGELFRRKKYLDEAAKIVEDAMRSLGVSREEEVRICTGYVLSKARKRLSERGYNVKPTKITGETQRLAEQTFLKSLRKLGLILDEEKPKRRFRSLLEWVSEDPAREKYVKTGWRSWRNKWRAIAGFERV
ncbi:hypothetical protein J7L70_06790 [Candidatus Bathyarchaeota archaeon]|nr:hypothetical protein [Candidatus Bathyarchaeota archaeon]